MTYKLNFTPNAKKDWEKLDNSTKEQFKKILIKRLETPCIPKDRMSGTSIECYKIKLRTIGARLVYAVIHNTVSLIVISIGKRENNQAYEFLDKKIQEIKDMK